MDGGRYRLDIQVGPRVFVEVDGFAYHWTPEQKRYDDKRRNELRLLGYEILVYDWKAVMDEPRRVVKETKTAIREHAPAGHVPTGKRKPSRCRRARQGGGQRPAGTNQIERQRPGRAHLWPLYRCLPKPTLARLGPLDTAFGRLART